MKTLHGCGRFHNRDLAGVTRGSGGANLYRPTLGQHGSLRGSECFHGAHTKIRSGAGDGLDRDSDNLLGSGLRVGLDRLDFNGLTVHITDHFKFAKDLSSLGFREERCSVDGRLPLGTHSGPLAIL